MCCVYMEPEIKLGRLKCNIPTREIEGIVIAMNFAASYLKINCI